MKIVLLIKTIPLKQFRQFFPLAFVIAVLPGIIVACKDKNKGNQDMSPCGLNPGPCKTVLEAKDFFLYKVGSYWVYEEETSHERDSLYVTDYANASNYDFDVYIKSSLSGYSYHYWPSYFQNIEGCSESSPVTKRCIYVNRAKFKFQDHLGETICFFVNYKQNDSLYTAGDLDYCPNSLIRVNQIFESYNNGSGSFSNVVKIQETCSFQEGKQPANLFYSKNVGLIRKELLDSNQVWNLVDYNIIQ